MTDRTAMHNYTLLPRVNFRGGLHGVAWNRVAPYV